MATLQQTTPLLSLPLELREYVYQMVLSHPTQGPELLRTCHEVYVEARKFLYQRPLSYRSQEVLYSWLATTPGNMLDHVSEISLAIQDVDLKPVLTSNVISSQSHSPSRLTTWDLYQADLDRLNEALRKFPNVKAITITAPSHQHSFLYHDFVSKVLDMLSSLYVDLRDLRLDGSFDYQELGFLSRMSRLESFAFDGFSASSPCATADTLTRLRHLKELSLLSRHKLNASAIS